jgi:hypothetical protein
MTINDAVKLPDNENKNIASIYFSLLRENKLFCHLSTFYKYASLCGRYRKKYTAIPKPNKYRAERVFQQIHIDTTFMMTEDDGKQRIVFVKDNYSKALLHKAIVPAGDSKYIKNILQECFIKHQLTIKSYNPCIITDGGSENKGEVDKWIRLFKDKSLTKIIANDGNRISNNMVESCNHFFKNVFLQGKIPKSKSNLLVMLDEFEEYYNYTWFPIEFYGLSPYEVLKGEIPDKNKFKSEILEARKRRIAENQSFDSQFCKLC